MKSGVFSTAAAIALACCAAVRAAEPASAGNANIVRLSKGEYTYRTIRQQRVRAFEDWTLTVHPDGSRTMMSFVDNFDAAVQFNLVLPGETVDGNDPLAVHAVTRRAVDRARAGLGPTLIEAMTYRWYDHAGLAGAKQGEAGAFGLPYRSDKDVRAWMARDPITNLRARLLRTRLLTLEDADRIVAEVKAEVAASLAFARASPKPLPESGLANVYAQGTVHPSQGLA